MSVCAMCGWEKCLCGSRRTQIDLMGPKARKLRKDSMPMSVEKREGYEPREFCTAADFPKAKERRDGIDEGDDKRSLSCWNGDCGGCDQFRRSRGRDQKTCACLCRCHRL